MSTSSSQYLFAWQAIPLFANAIYIFMSPGQWLHPSALTYENTMPALHVSSELSVTVALYYLLAAYRRDHVIMEHLEVLEPRAADQPDSLTSLLYALQFTTLQITLHSLAAIYFIIRLYALPFVFVYRHCAKRATSLFRLLGGTVASPLRAVRNISRLYHIVSWQTQVVGLAEVHKPSIGDAVSVESILLKRLGIQDYHESLEEVRRGDSVESPTSTSVARAGIDHVHEEPQTLVVAFKPVIQPILSAKADKPQEQNSCPECVHERSGCTICTLVTRNSSVDSHIPRRTKSDGEFRPPPPMNDEALKLPWRQLQPKKSGKLQKRMLKY